MPLATGFTVTVVLIEQPPGAVYTTLAIVGTGGAPAVSTPVVEEIVAYANAGTILHVPPVVASLKTVVSPPQTCIMPVIGNGAGFTVNMVVALQPVPIE